MRNPTTPSADDDLYGRKLCSFPECDRPSYARGLCEGHHKQHLRKASLRPLRTPPGQGSVVRVRCPRELKEAAERAAADEGVSPAEFWRRSIRVSVTRWRRRLRQ
jgi:hypothetical protein